MSPRFADCSTTGKTGMTQLPCDPLGGVERGNSAAFIPMPIVPLVPLGGVEGLSAQLALTASAYETRSKARRSRHPVKGKPPAPPG